MHVLESVKRYRKELLKTLLIYLSYLLFGACEVSPGTALLDIQVLIQESFATTSKLISIKQIGYICGGILVGVLEKYASSFLTLGFCMVSYGLIEILIPLTTNFILISCLCFFLGWFQGIVDMFLLAVLISLWKDKSTNFVQILHLWYAVGGLTCPLIFRPFMLPNDLEVGEAEIDVGHGLTPTPDEVKVHWAFLAVGIPTVLVGLCFFFFNEKGDEIKSSSEPTNSYWKTTPSAARQYIVCAFIAITSAFSFPTWLLVSCFSQAYGVKSSLKLSKQSSALISAIFWTVFIISRVVFIILSLCVKQTYLLVFMVSTLLGGSIILMACSSLGYHFFLTGIVLVAFGVSPLAGLTLSWPSKYFVYSGRQTSMILIIALIGESVHPVICGSFFDSNPDIFIYYLGTLGIGFAIMFSLLPSFCGLVCKARQTAKIEIRIDDHTRRQSISSNILQIIKNRRPTIAPVSINVTDLYLT